MIIMILKLYIIIILLIIASIPVQQIMAMDLGIFSGDLSPGGTSNRKTCTMERAYKLLGFTCAKLDLKEIPLNLRSDTEVLDVSYNRIRDLTARSFSRYTGLKFLYLFENMIQSFEENTFSQLTSLEAIDLSSNALTTIPYELLNLPFLRNLYAAHNNLKDIHEDLMKNEKPIAAPLQHLSLAYCKLNKIPDFGVLPELWQLNISGNPMRDIAVQQFSPMCNIKIVDFNGTRLPACTCQAIYIYFTKRSSATIMKHIDYCEIETELRCPDIINATTDAIEYTQCTELQYHRQISKKARITWISIASAVVGFLLVFLACLYYCHRRNGNKLKKLQQHEKLKRIHSTNTDDEDADDEDEGAEKVIKAGLDNVNAADEKLDILLDDNKNIISVPEKV